MLRTARLLALTGAAASVLTLTPSANAAQLICWYDRVIYTSDYRIHYREPGICR